MRIPTVLLVAAAALTLSPAAYAGWPAGGDTLVQYYGAGGGSMEIVPDGTGGMIAGITFPRQAVAYSHRYRVTGDGTVVPNWDFWAPAGWVSFTGDGTGGMFQSLGVSTGSNAYIDLQHVPPGGGYDPGWPPGGVRLLERTAGGASIDGATIASDDSGGVYVGCSAYDGYENGWLGVLVFRVLPDGSTAPGWPADGFVVRNVFGESYNQYYTKGTVVAPDGAGGVLVGFMNYAPGGSLAGWSMRAQRISRAGVRQWTVNGRLVSITHTMVGPILGMRRAGDFVYYLWAFDSSSTSGALQQIRLQCLRLSDGAVATGWPTTGMVIAEGSPDAPDMLRAGLFGDDGDGTLVAWSKGAELRGVRITSAGTPAAGWPAAGLSLVDAAAVTGASWAVARAPNGYVVCWADGRLADGWRARARWLLFDGSPDPGQPDTGRQIMATPHVSVLHGGALGDGAGGVYVGLGDHVWLTTGEFNSYMLTWVPYAGPLAIPAPVDASAPATLHAWPNPARGSLDVRFRLPVDAPAALELIDVAGHRVRAMTVRGAGERTARFEHLEALPAGVYFVRLAHAGHVGTTRVALVH